MVQTSKDSFELVLEAMEEFKASGQSWCDNADEVASAKARLLGKKIVKNIRSFASLSVTEAKEFAKKAAKTTPVVEPIVAESVGEINV